MLKGRDATQRDSDRCACVSLLKFNKTKYKVCIWAGAISIMNTGWAMSRLREALWRRRYLGY